MFHRFLIAATGLVLLGAAPREETALTRLAPGLQGTWKCVAFEFDGRVMPSIPDRIVISSDSIRYFNGDVQNLEERYQLGSANHLNTIDFQQVRRDNQPGFFLRGIYALDGDELKFCWGEERPNRFVTNQFGGGRGMCRLKRVKE